MMHSRGSNFRIAVAAFLLGWLAGIPFSYGYDGSLPLIFDWASDPAYYPGALRSPNMDQLGFQTVYTKYNPQPHLANWPWDNAIVQQMYDRLVLENRPVSFMLHSPKNCPITGTGDREAHAKTFDYLSGKGYRLDYVHMDFELDGGWPTPRNNAEVAKVVQDLRAHADPLINQARVGAFDLYPIDKLEYFPYPELNSQANTDLWNTGYSTTGVNVAMPNMYPWEYLEMHTHADHWGSNVAPNKRSALFWAPLEQLSAVKRVLPAGHQLIPFTADFVTWEHLSGYPDTYDAPPPPPEDNTALLQHARLRGADGYYLYASDIPAEHEQYRGRLLDAWGSLDWLYLGKPTASILNLATDKQSGLQWSGVVTNRGAAVLVSNLGNAAVQFAMPDVPGFNDQLIDAFNINPGEHRLEYYFQTPSAGVPIDIANPSFQSPATADGEDATASSWAASAAGCGAWNPQGTYFTDAAADGTPSGADGSQILYMSGPKYAHQVLTDTLQAGIYELTASVGRSLAGTISTDGDAFIFSLSTSELGGFQDGSPLMIFTAGATSLPQGAFEDKSFILFIEPDNPHIGEALRIDLGSVAGWGFFDNVRLDYYSLIAGDANSDGVVDADDAAILAANWLSTDAAGWGEGDFNEDGMVNDLDATILAANWSPTGDMSHVPEPAMDHLLLALGGIFACRNVFACLGRVESNTGSDVAEKH